jgi:hypothetical protein
VAFKSEIELELSTAITNGVFTISSVLLEIIGFINKSKTQKTLINRKKAKIKWTFDLILAL